MASERVEIRQTTIVKAKADALAGVRREINDVESRGLVLRVQPSGCVWQMRLQHQGKDRRITIGPVDVWSLAHARSAARNIKWHVTSDHGVPDAYWMKSLHDTLLWEDRKTERKGKVDPKDPKPPRAIIHAREERLTTWTYRQARDGWARWLASEAEVGNLTAETVRNYVSVVGCPAMRELDRIPVARIAASDVAKVTAALVKEGKRSQARDVVRVTKRMFGWLAEPAQERAAGISGNVLDRLKAPKLGAVKARQRFPDLNRLGLVVATARSGALRPVIAAAVELLAWTAQRRLTIARARVEEFEAWPAHEGWGIWRAGHRKTPKAKATGKPHSIPLPPPAWAAVQRHLTWLAEHEPETEWLFPNRRPAKFGVPAKSGHIEVGTLTKNLPTIPGADMSPHDVRRCFSSVLAEAGHHLAFVGYILDHATAGSETTHDEHRMTRRYTEAELLSFKRPVMSTWAELLEPAVQAADLLPLEELKAEIVRLRDLQRGVSTEGEKARMKAGNAERYATGRTTRQRKRASGNPLTSPPG
ncbi:tyrosine-type recombinase/integrase [Methylobacterium sp. D54C]